MKEELCYVGIAMHPQARKRLEEQYEVTDDESRIGQARAAICYGVQWNGRCPERRKSFRQ